MDGPGFQDVIKNNLERPRLEHVGEAFAQNGKTTDKQGPYMGLEQLADGSPVWSGSAFHGESIPRASVVGRNYARSSNSRILAVPRSERSTIRGGNVFFSPKT